MTRSHSPAARLAGPETGPHGAASLPSTVGDDATWTLQVTLCYGTIEQPAQPIITGLGMELPACQVDIGTASVVIQDGPERDWSWTTVATIRLRTTAVA